MTAVFSRPDEDLIRLDSGHPQIAAALAFEGDRLLYLEAVWLDGNGVPEQVDGDSLERLKIAARARGFELSVRDRIAAKKAGAINERIYVDLNNPDPMQTGGQGVHVQLTLGYDPGMTTDTWTADKMAAAVQAWGVRSVAAVQREFPNATVEFTAAPDQRMDIELTRVRGEGLRLRPMRRAIFQLVSDAGIVR